MSKLVVTPARCTGCRTCELACAFAHAEPLSSGAPSPRTPRIRVWTGARGRHLPLTCLQCDEARCLAACATGALSRAAGGWIELEKSRCTRCLLCILACPFGNIALDAGASPVKCDLCRGEPACARFCPSGTLAWRA